MASYNPMATCKKQKKNLLIDIYYTMYDMQSKAIWKRYNRGIWIEILRSILKKSKEQVPVVLVDERIAIKLSASIKVSSFQTYSWPTRC